MEDPQSYYSDTASTASYDSESDARSVNDPADLERASDASYDSDLDADSFDGERAQRLEQRFADFTIEDSRAGQTGKSEAQIVDLTLEDADTLPQSAREQFYARPFPAADASFDELETYRKAAVAADLPMRSDYLKRFLKHADELRSGRPDLHRQMVANFIRESARGTLEGTPAVIGRVLAEQHPEFARTVSLAGPRNPDLIGLNSLLEVNGVTSRFAAPSDGAAPVDRAQIDEQIGTVRDAAGQYVVRTMPRWREDGPAAEDDRFARLGVAENAAPAQPANARGRRIIARESVPFERIPVPPIGASFEVLNTYRLAAKRAGVTLTADDLKAFETIAVDLQTSHNALDIREQLEYVDRNTRPGVIRMLGALVEQPAALERLSDERKKFEKRSHLDRLEAYNDADFAPEMRAERVIANAGVFTSNLDALNALPPLPPNATFETVERYRETMRAVGIPLERSDFLLYRAAVAAEANGRAELPLMGSVPMPLNLLSGKNEVPLSLTVLDELRRPAHARQLLNLGPAAFAEVLRERLPGRNREIVPPSLDNRKPATIADLDLGVSAIYPAPGQTAPEINELPIFGPDGKLFDAALQQPQRGDDSRFSELDRLERAEGRLLRNPFARRFSELKVPAADASVAELNAYRRSANRAGVHISAADLKTYAELAAAHGSGSYPRLAVRLAADTSFAASAIADPRVRRHVVAMAEALVHQHRGQIEAGTPPVRVRDYSRDLRRERSVAETVNDVRSTSKEIAAAVAGGLPNEVERRLNEAAALKPLPPNPTPIETEYYRLALGSVGIPLGTGDIRSYEVAIAQHGAAGFVHGLDAAASPGLKALADLYRPREGRQILDGSGRADHLQKLDALLSAPSIAQQRKSLDEPTQDEVDSIVSFADAMEHKYGALDANAQPANEAEPTQDEVDSIVNFADALEHNYGALDAKTQPTNEAEPTQDEVDSIVNFADAMERKYGALGKPGTKLGELGKPAPGPELEPAAHTSPLPYLQLTKDGPKAGLATANFKPSGPVTLDENGETFVMQFGPSKLQFKVDDVVARLAPGADRSAFVALLKHNANVQIKQTSHGVSFAEPVRTLDRSRGVQYTLQ